MGRRKIYDDRTKYINDWTRANRDRMTFKFQKGITPMIRAFAKQQNLSVTAFVLESVQKNMDEIYKHADEETRELIDQYIKDFMREQEEKDKLAGIL